VQISSVTNSLFNNFPASSLLAFSRFFNTDRPSTVTPSAALLSTANSVCASLSGFGFAACVFDVVATGEET
jgi:hypothetical protein